MALNGYKSKYCEVSYLQDKDAILCKWLQKCSKEDYKAPLIYGLKLLEETKATIWITDTTNGFENEIEDSEWLIKEFIPRTIESSCKKVVFIIDDTSFLKSEIDTQSKVLGQYFELLQVKQLEELTIKNYLQK